MMKYLKSLLLLTDGQDQRRLWFLGAFMLLAAFIELLSVGSLFPYIKILSNPSIINSNHYLNKVYNALSFSSQAHFLIFVGFLIFLMILGKGIITMLNNYFQAKFTARMNNKIAKKILNSYVNMDYSEFSSVNSAALSKHLLYDVQNVIGVISGILNMLTSILVGMALIALMLLADPGAVITSVFLLLFFLQLITKLTKNRMNRLGESNEYNNRKAYKIASEIFLGIKDIKMFDVENFFVEKYNATRKILSSQLVVCDVISNLPNVAMNIIGFGILMGVLLYLLFTKGSMINVLPIIAIIAICIQRLLPTISVVSTSIGLMRQFKPVVFIVSDAIKKLNSPIIRDSNILVSDKKLKFNHKIRFDNISYKYSEAEGMALKGISFNIEKNKTLGIVGASGAGKSTLIDVLLGLYLRSSGTIYCDNVDISRDNYPEFRSLIGYVPQRTFLLDTTIKENIAFGVDENAFDNNRLEKSIKISQLKELIDQLPNGIDTMIGENGLKLSGGQRQRLGIARALYKDPEILILDEATNALDSITESEFNRSLKALMGHKTLIIIAHRLSSIDFCDHLIVIEEGKIVSKGDYQSVTADQKFKALYPKLINV